VARTDEDTQFPLPEAHAARAVASGKHARLSTPKGTASCSRTMQVVTPACSLARACTHKEPRAVISPMWEGMLPLNKFSKSHLRGGRAQWEEKVARTDEGTQFPLPEAHAARAVASGKHARLSTRKGTAAPTLCRW
jgi:hypothetical protein